MKLFPLIGVLLTVCSALPAQTISERYLLAAANRDRAEHGIPPVHLDAHLADAARNHAREMVAHASISHGFPGEPDLAARASAAGAQFSLVTENVAEAPSSAIIHDLWMQSAGHRANLLDPAVDAVGISVLSRNRQLYAVEDFARTVPSLTLSDQERQVAILIAQSGLALQNETADARRTCTMSTGYSGSRRPWFVMRYTAADLSRLPSELTSRLASGKYHQAAVGACSSQTATPFTAYNIAVLLYP